MYLTYTSNPSSPTKVLINQPTTFAMASESIVRFNSNPVIADMINYDYVAIDIHKAPYVKIVNGNVRPTLVNGASSRFTVAVGEGNIKELYPEAPIVFDPTLPVIITG